MLREGEEVETLITRQEAIDVLMDLCNANIFDIQISSVFEDLIYIIRQEMEGRHMWGASTLDCEKLDTAVRADLITDEYEKECWETHMKSRFIPAESDMNELEQYFFDEIGNNIVTEDDPEYEILKDEKGMITLEEAKDIFKEHYGVSMTEVE